MRKRCATLTGILFAGLFLCLAFSSAIPTPAQAGDTIKIAHFDPLSGPFEYAGRLYKAGIEFAIMEQNAKGGLLGKKIELLSVDSELKPDVATRKAKKAILEDKVDFIASGTGSHITIALNKVATAYKTKMINYGGMSDIVMGKEFSPYAFRVCQNSYNFTAGLAQLMATKPYRRFYIVCQDYAWGHDVAKAFKEQIKIYMPDAEIVGEDYHPLATKDFGPYINKVVAAKADAIFSGNWGPDCRLLVKQSRALGLKAPFPLVLTFGVDPYVEQEVGDDAIGIHYVYDYTLRVDTPENLDMIKRYRESGHKNDEDVLTQWPVGSIGHTIIGWKMVFAAVEKAGTLDTAKFTEAFEGFEFDTPVGKWRMRACDHQVILPMFGGVVEKENPYFKFPWLGSDILKFEAEKAAIPATKEYNERCGN